MTSNWQIILAVIIVGLSILMPIYYIYQRKKKAQQEELNKIKVLPVGACLSDFSPTTKTKTDKFVVGFYVQFLELLETQFQRVAKLYCYFLLFLENKFIVLHIFFSISF